MLQLYSSPASPFGRKIKLAIHALGMAGQLAIIDTDTNDPDHENRQLNPLGKIPTLRCADGVLYDSRVIMGWLDRQRPGLLFGKDDSERTAIEVGAALADGMMDAAILIVYESRFRPETHIVPAFVDYQRDKIIRALAQIEARQLVYANGASPKADEIGLACLIDYLDLRHQLDWRDHAPSLASWMTAFAASVSAYQASLPPGVAAAPWRQI